MKLNRPLLKLLRKTQRCTDAGDSVAPSGPDFKRIHRLCRLGYVRPIHGRKGEGLENFVITAAGRAAEAEATRIEHLTA